jgi:hypothetical protein
MKIGAGYLLVSPEPTPRRACFSRRSAVSPAHPTAGSPSRGRPPEWRGRREDHEIPEWGDTTGAVYAQALVPDLEPYETTPIPTSEAIIIFGTREDAGGNKGAVAEIRHAGLTRNGSLSGVITYVILT